MQDTSHKIETRELVKAQASNIVAKTPTDHFFRSRHKDRHLDDEGYLNSKATLIQEHGKREKRVAPCKTTTVPCFNLYPVPDSDLPSEIPALEPIKPLSIVTTKQKSTHRCNRQPKPHHHPLVPGAPLTLLLSISLVIHPP